MRTSLHDALDPLTDAERDAFADLLVEMVRTSTDQRVGQLYASVAILLAGHHLDALDPDDHRDTDQLVLSVVGDMNTDDAVALGERLQEVTGELPRFDHLLHAVGDEVLGAVALLEAASREQHDWDTEVWPN